MRGPFSRDGVAWWLADAAPGSALERAARALAALRAGKLENRRTGRRKELYALRLDSLPGSEDAGAPDHLLKVSRYRGGAAWRKRLRGSKARRELALAEAVSRRGIPTPVPLAAGEERGARLRSCYLLVPFLEGATDLLALWRERALPPAERRELVVAFARLVRAMHDAGVLQEDLAPNNFLARRASRLELFAIDFERTRLRAGLSERERVALLAKLERFFATAPDTDRWRFLRAYGGATARRLAHHLEERAPRRAHADAARLGRTALRAGRRFTPAVHGAWRGFERRDADPAVIAAALEARQAPLLDLPNAWLVGWSGVAPRELRRRWLVANLLHLRGGLAPLPLGCWSDGRDARLLLAAPEGGRTSREPERGTRIRVLLRRTARLAELAAPEPGDPRVALVPDPDAGLRAVWLDPTPVHVTGRASARERLQAWLEPSSR